MVFAAPMSLSFDAGCADQTSMNLPDAWAKRAGFAITPCPLVRRSNRRSCRARNALVLVLVASLTVACTNAKGAAPRDGRSPTPAPSTTASATGPPTTFVSLLRALEHNDLASLQAAQVDVEPGSPAARYLAHETLMRQAFNAIGARPAPSTAAVDGDGIRICAVAQVELDVRCRVYSSPAHALDRRVSTFRLDGVDVGSLAPGATNQTAEPTAWDAAAGVSVTLRSILRSPPGQLEFVLQIANSTARPFAVSTPSFPFSYVTPGTRVSRRASGWGFPPTVEPSTTALVYVAFTDSTLGGLLTMRSGSTTSTQIAVRPMLPFRLPLGPPA
jgi:hypothetical protein